MKSAKHISTLFYYDGPQIIEARDRIGAYYLGVLSEADVEGDRFLIVGVPPDRLRKFRQGGVDLLDLILENGQEEWFLTHLGSGLNTEYQFESQPGDIDGYNNLPDAGFFLHSDVAVATALAEARARNNFVLDVALDPPESAGAHTIKASTLSGVLAKIQGVVKWAYSEAVKNLSAEEREKRDLSDAHVLNVAVPACAGSFRVVFESAKPLDLIGDSELGRALLQIDQLFDTPDDFEKTIEILKTKRGRLAGAYSNLVGYLSEADTGLRYSWAQPNSPNAVNRSITSIQAREMSARLSEVVDLTVEKIVLVGDLSKADSKSGTWRLDTDEGSYSGKTIENGPTLSNLTIGKRYRFTCNEEVEEVDGGTKEKTTYYLVELDPI